MNKVVNTDEEPKYTQPVSDLCRHFIQCCMQRNPEERLNVYKLIRHPYLNVTKQMTKKPITLKDPIDLFFADATVRKTASEQSFEQDQLKRSATETPATKDFKQIANKYRESVYCPPSRQQIQKTVAAPEKDFTFETPCIIDAQGNVQRFFTGPVESNDTKPSPVSTIQSERNTFRLAKPNTRKSQESDVFTVKQSLGGRVSAHKKLRIPIVRHGNTSMESNQNENSRNLAINFKNRDLTLKLKAHTSVKGRPKITQSRAPAKEDSNEEFSDFDFDYDDQPEEVTHEVKITIKETRKPLRPIPRKPFKTQETSKTEKVSKSVYEPKEADLLNNTHPMEFVEVPKLVLGPPAPETPRDLRSPFGTVRAPLAKPARVDHSPADLLSLDINPSHQVLH